MKRLLTLALLPAAMLTSLSSCTGNESEYSVTRNVTDNFNYVTDLSNGSTKIVENSAFSINFNYTDSKASVALKNVPTGDDKYSDLVITGLSFEITSHMTLKIDAKNVHPDGNRSITFDELKIEYLDRTIDQIYLPVVEMSYTVDNKYSVTSVAYHYYLRGTTTTTPTQGETFTSKESLYVLELDPKEMKANLDLTNIRFANQMPLLDMRFTGLSLSLSEKGYIISTESVIPTVDNTPFPAFEIKNLNGVGSFDGTLKMSFSVGRMGSVSADLDV